MSQAEPRDEVIKYAAKLGYVVTAPQLARWHRAGLLPRPRQQPLGRGRGTETVYPPGTAAQVVALCQIKDDERRLGRVAFRLWWEGFDVDLGLIRNQLVSAMEPLEIEVRKRAAKGRSPLEGGLRRSLGQQRVEAITATMRQAASTNSAPPAKVSWEAMEAWPPTLDDVAAMLGEAAAARIAGTPVATLIADASDGDLVAARDRTRAMVALLRNAAAPMAWLYGKSGSVFRMVDRLMDTMTPSDHLGMVAAMLAFTPFMRSEVLAVLDAGTQPPLAQQLRQILAIRDQVPGATGVLTPMAIRALLRDKEAAGRYRPRIEEFLTEHREKIDAVLAAMQSELPSSAADAMRVEPERTHGAPG
jgi:hypothetical protein